MDYIFGTATNNGELTENVKTVGKSHTNISGFHEVNREYPDCTITDRFRVIDHCRSEEDAEGNCYDWYNIDKHNRIIDRTPPLKETEALTLELAADHEARLCNLELGV